MNIRGVIETVHPRQIRGWAYDEDAPRIHVSIVAAVMGIDVATGEASLFRKDLAEAGVGDGDHSFVLDLDPPLSLEAIERLQIYAIGRDGSRSNLHVRTWKSGGLLNVSGVASFP